MDDSQYDDLVGHRAEVDRVREASYQRTAYLPLDAKVCHRFLDDTAKRPVDLRGKRAAKARTLVLVPVAGVE
jgi:hypothetical protein